MKNKKLFWGIFAVIMLGAIFLRTWHHSEWLFFKWDQGRDAALLAEAVEKGPGELPLLGPRATRVGQDYLQLGPAYYYLQYLPAGLLNSTHPAAFAYFDLIMSILTIPLLYAFCRLYFSPKHSLIITSLYAFSFLVIQYSRFAWNPNSVPLLMLLTFYGMLRFAQSKKLKNQIKWLALWALGFSLASQFHFYAFFSLVGICGIFLLYHFNLFQFKKLPKNIKKLFTKNLLKAFGVALGVILLTYTPMIISELKTDFSNSKLFLGAFSEKSREDKTFNEKLIRNFREQAKGYFLITTSFEHRSGNKADPIPVSFGLLAMLAGIVLSVYFYRKEKSQVKKNFLFLVPTWIIFFFLLTISTSYGLRPRYFVPVFPIPFLIIGLFFVWLDKNIPKKAYLLTTLIAIAVLFLNLYGIKQWFVNTALSQNEAIPTYRNLILKKDDGITLGQFERVTGYILKNTPSSEKHVLIWSKAEYKQPLSYLLERQRPDVNWDWVNKSEELYGKDMIFAVNTTSGGHESVSKYVKNYTNLQTSIQFGQIIVMKLKINSSEIPEPEPKEEEDQGDGGKTERLFWKDVF
jgi:hypothetical protein